MKQRELRPALAHIERRLFGVTDGLLQLVDAGRASPAIAARVRAAPEWADYEAQKLQSETQSAEDTEPIDAATATTIAVPPGLRDLMRRRVASLGLAAQPLPQPGQIVRIEQIHAPREKLDAVLLAPLHVLLDEASESPNFWYGWLVSSETEYAGWWDFVLQEEDAPFDPEAAMVQLWNPVTLYIPMAATVVGRLSPARLQAVRSLAADFVTGQGDGEVRPWPGRVAARTTLDGLSVVTGSPLRASGDPRAEYQALYHEAAEAIREPARIQQRALASLPQDRRGSLWQSLIEQAGRTLVSLLPQPRVATAMSGEEEAIPDLLWPDMARLRLMRLEEAGGSLEVEALSPHGVAVYLMANELIEERHRLQPCAVQQFDWDQGTTHLILESGDDAQRRLKLDLHEAGH